MRLQQKETYFKKKLENKLHLKNKIRLVGTKRNLFLKEIGK